MPGNGVGERVHNFFAQDTLSQGQHQSEVLDQNLPALSNNLWAGNQGSVGVPSYTTKVDTGRGSTSHLLNGPPGLQFTRSTLSPEIQLQTQQQNLNGYTYGNLYETRQDEGNFLAADIVSDQRNVGSVGSSFFEQSMQGVGLQHQAQMVSSGASLSSGNFGLHGGQQLMSRHQLNMLQPLQLQQTGIKDLQHLQQQVMFMRMQELHRQQKLQQPDGRQQNSLNQSIPFQKVVPSSYPFPQVHSNVHSGALGFPGATDTTNTNWLHGCSSALQLSHNGVPSSNYGQGHHMMTLTNQQTDQSLFGVPVSSSRASGSHSSQYSQGMTAKPKMQQSASFNSSFPFQQYAQLPDQISAQDGTVVSRQRFIGENIFGNGPNQSLNNAINIENLQEVNAVQQSETMQEFQAREEPAIPSVNPQEKASKQANSSHNEVGLDPTEERILFGSDDNIWDAFGKCPNTGEEVSNSLDGSGLPHGFSSIQGGTWSALMQSAVAEASRTDVGPQEEWSGLNFHTNVVPSGNQNVSTHDNGKEHSALMDAHISSTPLLNSEAGQPSVSDYMKNSYVSHPGFQQFVHKFPNDITQNMQSNSVQRLVQPSEEGSKWPDVAPLQMSGDEGSHMQMNTSHRFDAGVNVKVVSSSWMDELDGSSKNRDKLNDWSALGSAMATEDASARIHSSHNYSNSLDSSHTTCLHGDAVHTAPFWKADPEISPAVTSEVTRYSPASAPINSELVASSLNGTEETGRFLLKKNQVKYWKNANTLSMGKESQGLERSHSHIMKDNNILNALEMTSQTDAKTQEADACDKPANSNDSYQSNVSHQKSAGSLRENVLLDSSDSRSLATGKEKLYNQIGKKNSARKFQYHPMGNLDGDVDPPYGLQKALCKEGIASQTAHYGQSKLFIQGQSSNALRDGKGLADVHSQSYFPSSVSNMSAPLTRSVDIPPHITASPSSSPSMLQLLPKVDQSRVFGATMHQNTLSAEIPKAGDSDGPVGRVYPSHPSAAQVFGLQLGPPSQLMPVQNHLFSPQSSMVTVSSSSPSIGDKVHIASLSQDVSFHSSSETAQGGYANKSVVQTNDNNENSHYKMHAKFHPAFSSGSPFPKSRIQNQRMATGHELKGQHPSTYFKGTPCFHEGYDSYRDPSSGTSVKNFSHEVASNVAGLNLPKSLCTAKQTNTVDPHEILKRSVNNSFPVSQLPSSSIMSQQASYSKNMDNTWNTSKENPFSAPSREEPSTFSCLHQSNIVGTSSATENRGDQDATTGGGNVSTEAYTSFVNPLSKMHQEEQHIKESPSQHESFRGIDSVEEINKAQEEHIINNLSDVHPVCSASMQRDIEAFGRSLKPNNLSYQNYSLLNQIQAMNNAESEQSSKALNISQASYNGPLDQEVSHVVVPSVDSRMPKISETDPLERNVTSQEVNIPTQLHVIHMDDPQTISQRKNEHTHVSPQMAPTWFNHFGSGTFKNGQVLAMHDTQKTSSMKMCESPLVLDKSSSSLHTFNTKKHLIPASNDISRHARPTLHTIPGAATELFCASPLSSVGKGDQHSLPRSKKRKHVISDLNPWCNLVSQGLRNLQAISLGEREWAEAADRVVEKVEEDVESNGSVPPRHRARRRLILSTQLMQQLFQPLPRTILFSNSYAEYEAVAYMASRLALGDACGVVPSSKGDYIVGTDGKEILYRRCKTLEDSYHHLAKVLEEFTERGRKLEDEFSKLDRRASLVDLVTENQDLEKFSVINRFAKFYGRGGQANGTGSSPDAATHPCTSFAQRHVTLLPLPRDLPSGVQCFSL
ncbi:unnamed protein product [Cuscuta epithymum]|uniref:Uncharacterized protein n=1 Tax=Cuscuta epithymum TaxID=186058 RepID=A0AAV0EAP8_9ASTE|nr:unnamed protein product [Cuscuta epithymum]